MNCRVCEQELRERTNDTSETGDFSGHHQEKSPIEPGVCLGCWIFELELQKFILRKTGRSLWTLKADEVLRGLLARFREFGTATVIGVPVPPELIAALRCANFIQPDEEIEGILRLPGSSEISITLKTATTTPGKTQ